MMTQQQRNAVIDGILAIRERVHRAIGLKNTLPATQIREDLQASGDRGIQRAIEELMRRVVELEKHHGEKTKSHLAGMLQDIRKRLNNFEQKKENKTAKGSESMGKTYSTEAIERAVLKEISARDNLAVRLLSHGFSCDHSLLTFQELAARACKHFGVGFVAGQEKTALEAYLTGSRRGYKTPPR